VRFVVVGTMVRGALDPPEPLDENGQVLAAYRMQMDEAELQYGERVVWNPKYAPKRERMSETAAAVLQQARVRELDAALAG
jgi:hypothetical protein